MAFNPFEGEQAAGPFNPFAEDIPAKPKEEPGFTSAIKRTAGQMASAAGLTAEDVVGKNSVTQAVRDWGQEVQAANPAGIQAAGDVIDRPGQWVKESSGSMLTQMGPQLAGGLTGRAIGGGIGLLGGPGGVLAGQEIGGRIGQAVPTFIQEYGGMREQQQREGKNDLSDKLLAAGAAVPATAIEFAFGPQRLLGRALEGALPEAYKQAAKGGGKEIAKFIAKEGAKQGAGEALEEVPQGLLESMAGKGWNNGEVFNPLTSPEAWKDAGFSALMALPGGALLGGGMSGVNLMQAANQNKREVQPTTQLPATPEDTAQMNALNADLGGAQFNYENAIPSEQLALPPGVITVPNNAGGETVVDSNNGPISSAAVTAVTNSTLAEDVASGMPLKGYSPEQAKEELASRPDADRYEIKPHPVSGDRGRVAIVPKSAQALAEIDAKASAGNEAMARNEQLAVEEDSRKQSIQTAKDVQSLQKQVIDMHRSAAAIEKSITLNTSPQDAAIAREQAADLRSQAKTLNEQIKEIANAPQVATDGGQGSGGIAGGSTGNTQAVGGIDGGRGGSAGSSVSGRGADLAMGDASVSDAALDELAPAPVQPMSEMPAMQVIAQKRAQQATQQADVRAQQLAQEEGTVAEQAPPTVKVPRPMKVGGLRAAKYSDEQLQAVVDNANVPATSRRAAAAEIAWRQAESEAAAQTEIAQSTGKMSLPRDDSWLADLFSQSTTPEAAAVDAENNAKSAQAKIERSDAAIAMLTGEIHANTAEAAELAARKYKQNRKQVELKGDGPLRNPSMSVSQINENRRRRAIEAKSKSSSAMAKAIDSIASDADGFFGQVADMVDRVTQQFNEGFFGPNAVLDDQLDMAVGSLVGASQASGEKSAGRQIRMAAVAYKEGEAPAGKLSRQRAGESPADYQYRMAAEKNAAKAQRQQQPQTASEEEDIAAVRRAIKDPKAEVSVVSEESMPDMDKAAPRQVSKQSATFLRHVAKTFGKEIVFVDGMESDGFYRSGNKIYLSNKSSVHHVRVLGHEMLHAMKRQNRASYDKLLKAVSEIATDAQLTGQFKDYFAMDAKMNQKADAEIAEWLTDPANREMILEEMMADLSGNRWAESSFWESVFTKIDAKYGSEQAKGIIAKLRLALVNALNKLMSLVKGGQFKVDARVAEHLESIREALATGFADYAKAVKDKQVSESGAGGVKFARGTADQTLPTRWPTGKNLTVSVNDNMITDLATLKLDQKQYEKAVNAVLEEPGMHSADMVSGTVDEKAEHVVKRMVSNLLWLYDQVPEAIRERSKLWYDGARKVAEAWSKTYDITESQAAGALAVLSPQKDWFMNVTMAERVLDIIHTKMDHKFDQRMDAAAFSFLTKDSIKDDPEARKNLNAYQAVKDKTLRQVAAHHNLREMSVWIRAYDEAYHDPKHAIVTPEGGFVEDKTTVKGEPTLRGWGDFTTPGKAASIYLDGSPENINKMLGSEHKVRNFYNNIYAPKDARFTTIDTHAVAADMLRPLAGADKPVAENFGKTGGTNVTGLSGTYALHYEAYRRAAEARGVLPREMQSITWEAVRGLFTEGYKGKKDNVRYVDSIWQQVDDGKMTVDQARKQISEHAGGIENPDWYNDGNAEYQAVLRDKTYVQNRPPFQGAKVTFEVAPDPRNKKQKSRWDALSQNQKNVISHRVAWKIAAKALASFGDENMKGELHQQLGGWLKDTNPSLSIWFNKRAAGTKIADFARIIGYALNQMGMMRTSPKPFDTGRVDAEGKKIKGVKMGAIQVKLTPGMSDAEIHDLYTELRTITGKRNKPYINGHTTADGVMIILHDDVKAGISTEDIAQRVSDRLFGRFAVGYDHLYADFPAKGKDSYGFRVSKGKEGEDLGLGAEPSVRARADQLRAESGVLIDQLIGEAEQGKFSPARSDAAGDERTGGLAASGVGEVPSYGTASTGSVKATGIHYSGSERSNLDGRYYGTGAKGRESDRVLSAQDKRLRERIYFYVDSGKGITPEQGVGSIPHSVNLNNLYDGNADTFVQESVSRELKGNDWMSAFESAVIDAGFDGYISDFGTQRAVVLIGRHNVPVAAGKSTVASPQKPQAQSKRTDLPMGKMTGAEWKKLEPRATDLEDGKMYYRDDIKFSPARKLDKDSTDESLPQVWYRGQIGASAEKGPFDATALGAPSFADSAEIASEYAMNPEAAGLYGFGSRPSGYSDNGNVAPYRITGKIFDARSLQGGQGTQTGLVPSAVNKILKELGLNDEDVMLDYAGKYGRGSDAFWDSAEYDLPDSRKILAAYTLFDQPEVQEALRNKGYAGAVFNGAMSTTTPSDSSVPWPESKVHGELRAVMPGSLSSSISPDIRYSPPRWYFSPLEKAFESAPDKVFGQAAQVKLWLAGNNGQFSPTDPDIRRSPARSAATGQPIIASWASPEISSFDNIVRQLQDKLIDTKRVVDAIRGAGKAISDVIDPYLQEILYHGRAAKKTQDFAEQELRPMLQAMQMRKVTMQEIEDYLWAQHAPERNAQNAKAGIQDGSGLTDGEARDILAGRAVTKNGRSIQLNAAKMQDYRDMSAKVKAINDKTLDELVAYGLETRATVDQWKRTYQNYVPLMRDMSDDNYAGANNRGLGTGKGFSVRGSASKRAIGSQRGVIDIMANIAMQRERAITRGEKNKVSQATYGLALAAPNPDFWLPIDPAANRNPAAIAKLQQDLISLGMNPIDAQNVAQEPVQTYIDPRTGQASHRINPALRNRNDVLAVRINGEDKFLMFSSNDRAQAMVTNLKNLDDDQLGGFLQASAKITRWFASVNTQYNPVFGMVNGIRDFGGAMLNLTSTPLAGQQARVAKYGWDALRGIYSDLRDHRDGRKPSSAWAQEFEEFASNGGQTGYRDMFNTAEDRTKSLQKELERMASGDVKKWTSIGENHPVFAWLSDYNTAIENAFRLAAYKVAKENGMTQARAAQLAKNLTVNFNKKGLAATQTGALYAFFNAAVQGTARIGETLLQHNGNPSDYKNIRLSKMGKQIVLGGITLGVMQALLGAMAGWDDDEPKQFQRERNLIIPDFLFGSDKYISLPLPLGFHVLPNLGRITTEFMLSGFKNPGKRLTDLLGVMAEAFNPIGNAGMSLQTIAPTFADPLVALATNKDWNGQSIAREDFNRNKPTPGWSRTKDNASPWGKTLAYALNYVSGGGEYGKGMISPTPDQIDYLTGQVFGGVGREIIKLATSAKTVTSGEELPMYKVPIAGRFVGETTGVGPESGRFYDNLEKIGAHDFPLKKMKEERDLAGLRDYLNENPEAKLIKMADKAQRDISDLRMRKRKTDDPERVKSIESMISLRMKSFNNQVRNLQERSG